MTYIAALAMLVLSAMFGTAAVKFDALNRRITQDRAVDAFLTTYEDDDPDLAEWIRDHGPREYEPRIRWFAATASAVCALSAVSLLTEVLS